MNDRFEFGKNWSAFLATVDENKIDEATRELKAKLGSLDGKRLLDVGSGSGLHSLAAVRLGARVTSFDYDEQSVQTTRELKRRFAADSDWRIQQGSALDRDYLRSLGQFDVVYSWGVLHHTGRMWDALDAVLIPLAPGGRLMVAIYADPGWVMKNAWLAIKWSYNQLPRFLRPLFVIGVMFVPECVKMVFEGGPVGYIRYWREYYRKRGMSRWHDLVDWVGGYPYEVATAEQIVDYYKVRGLRSLAIVNATTGIGCNQLIFSREAVNVGETRTYGSCDRQSISPTVS